MQLCDTVLAKAAIEHPDNEVLLLRLLQVDSSAELIESRFTPEQGNLFDLPGLALLPPAKKPARSAVTSRYQATGT